MNSRVYTESLSNGVQKDDMVYEEFYDEAKQHYVINANEIIGDSSNHKNLFSWLERDLTLHFVHRTSYVSNYLPIIFATPYMGIKIKKYDAIKETESFLMRNESNPRKILSMLFKNDFFDFESNKIIDSSIGYFPNTVYPERYSDTFLTQEYENATKELQIAPIELLKFNKTRIHLDLYNFEDMLAELNHDQFSIELLECIDAYNNQKFFIAAAGLGSVIEHLLYLILEKNNLIDRHFPKSPTYRDYIRYMKKEPINLDHRSNTYIDSVFMQRNSISHFNKGFTSKNICDQMLQGIINIYDNYY